MSFGRLKAVVCDADGTLFQLKAPLGETYSDILHRFGYRLDAEVFASLIKGVWSSFEPEYLNVAESYRTTPERERAVWYTFIEKICAECGLKQVNSAAKAALYNYFAKGESRCVNQEVKDFLDAALGAGFSLYLATNNDLRIHALLQELGLTQYFTSTFTAGELGWKKPAVEFFHTIAKIIEVAPHEIIHLGNDERLDVTPAMEAGWNAVAVTPGNSATLKNIAGTFLETRN